MYSQGRDHDSTLAPALEALHEGTGDESHMGNPARNRCLVDQLWIHLIARRQYNYSLPECERMEDFKIETVHKRVACLRSDDSQAY